MSAPSTPTLTIADNGDGTGVVATIADSDAGTTNTVYYAKWPNVLDPTSATWTEGGGREDDGTIDISVTVGHAFFYATSEDGSGNQSVSNMVGATVTTDTITDSATVQTATAIVDAIEAARASGQLGITDFEPDWDFEGRVKDKPLIDNTLYVRVVVPRRYSGVGRFDTENLEYTAYYDIDVRQKIDDSNHDTSDQITRARLAALSRLVEQIHEVFHGLDGGHLPTSNYDACWIDESDNPRVKSEILIGYSVKHLREKRMFYGCCREAFQVTA